MISLICPATRITAVLLVPVQKTSIRDGHLTPMVTVAEAKPFGNNHHEVRELQLTDFLPDGRQSEPCFYCIHCRQYGHASEWEAAPAEQPSAIRAVGSGVDGQAVPPEAGEAAQ